MRHLLGLAIGAVVLMGASSAHAGWLSMDKVEFPGDNEVINSPLQNTLYETDSKNHTYEWFLTDATYGTAYLTDYSYNSLPDDHTYTESIDGDPFKTLWEELFNETTDSWVGYKLSIATPTPHVTVKFVSADSSFSDALKDAPVVSDTQILFSGVTSNSPLGPGESAFLKYVIQITPEAGFVGPAVTYCITATPMIPEPASLGLLALGALGLLTRRKA